MFREYIKRFAGKTVLDFNPAKGIVKSDIAYRLRGGHDGPDFDEMLAAYLSDPKAPGTEALVFGMWGHDYRDSPVFFLIKKLVESKKTLANLRHLFLGDILSTEAETIWIEQGDVSPLFPAFPLLETLRIRGTTDLEFRKPKHDGLKKLIIESAALTKDIVESLCKAKFPALEHLELWLGGKTFGGDVEIEDLAPILSGDLFPNLRSLGLCNSAMSDELAAAVADAPILERLETLDLSKGNLSDKGAKALMQFPLVTRLKKLDLRHHYLTPKCVADMKRLKIKVVATEGRNPKAKHRSVFCSE